MSPSPLKPPVSARLPAFSSVQSPALSGPAIEVLFRCAATLTEGASEASGQWFGSVMITFDLARVAKACRGLESATAVEHFASLASGSVRVRVRGHRLARAEIVRRFPDRNIDTVSMESSFRHEGNLLHMDIDLEVPVEVPSAGSGNG